MQEKMIGNFVENFNFRQSTMNRHFLYQMQLMKYNGLAT